LIYETLFRDHGLGRPLGGTPEDVSRIGFDALAAFKDERVHRATIGIIVVGPSPLDAAVDTLDRTDIAAVPHGLWQEVGGAAPPVSAMTVVRTLASDYAYVAFAVRGYAYSDARRATADVVAMLIGGSSRSILYEEIRSRLGLAYLLDCAHRCYSDSGVLRVVVATSPANVSDLVKETGAVFERAAATGWAEDEVEVAKEQCRGRLLLETENSAELAALVGRHRFSGRVRGWSPRTYLESLTAVSAEDVRSVFTESFGAGVTVAVAGGVERDVVTR
jgi:predicted Zn-dependent peptidase